MKRPRQRNENSFESAAFGNTSTILYGSKNKMAHLSPYLKFNGNCKQALEFYKSVLGGQLNLQTIGDSPAAGQFPAAMKDRILHGSLVSDNSTIFGTDVTASGLTRGDNL